MGKYGKTCCVVGCHHSERKKPENVIFYCFPSRKIGLIYENERRQKWIKAVNRINPDGTPWEPNNDSRICSEHFAGGRRSTIIESPSYIPSIFPTNHVEKKSQTQVDRFNRHLKRRPQPSPSCSKVYEREDEEDDEDLEVELPDPIIKVNKATETPHKYLKGQFTPETKLVRYIFWDMESSNYY